MADTTTQSQPPPIDPVYDDTWEVSVEARFKRLTFMVYADGAIAGVAVVLGYLAFRGLSNLAKNLGQVAQVTGGLQAAVFGVPTQPTVAQPPDTVDRHGQIDETREPPESDVAEPYQGPANEPSDEVRELMHNDDIMPKDIGREPYRGIEVDPMLDRPDG